MSIYLLPSSCQIAKLAEIYDKVFGEKTDGTFVDVGAYDGYEYSNTWCLANVGWSGIMYEPVWEFYEACVKTYAKHPKVKVINKAISSIMNSVRRIWVNGPVSTMDLDWVNKGRPDGSYGANNTQFVSSDPLDVELVLQAAATNIDVVSIDVEGMELEVLDGFTVGYWQPTLVIIEAHEFNVSPLLSKNAPEINAYFAANNYLKIYADDINSIFRRKI